jgi:hypothetical protein
VPHSGPPATRGHLRLAAPPAAPPRAESRLVLLVVAAAARLALFLTTVVAWTSTALALAPLLWRRAPLGGRLRPLRTREARVIRLQPRQQQQALPR